MALGAPAQGGCRLSQYYAFLLPAISLPSAVPFWFPYDAICTKTWLGLGISASEIGKTFDQTKSQTTDL